MKKKHEKYEHHPAIQNDSAKSIVATPVAIRVSRRLQLMRKYGH
jgi:hypothetical protein